ncbi:hypothetical protein NW765_005215 [Fusarium oxysporum]|nr:hypothetical protein NW765_005215 [Fusarium oxysporum]
MKRDFMSNQSINQSIIDEYEYFLNCAFIPHLFNLDCFKKDFKTTTGHRDLYVTDLAFSHPSAADRSTHSFQVCATTNRYAHWSLTAEILELNTRGSSILADWSIN